VTDFTPFMTRALALAAKGRGAVEPNPMVGAVVLDASGRVVGEGWHARFGGPHAEVNALAAAGERAKGGTLVVTLEPCCHFGKTPPCTEAVIRSCVSRVVVGMADPFPKVAGGGIATLRASGIEVIVGVCQDEAERLNAPYLKLLRTGRPWVIQKWAMTLDGKMATHTGDSKWISSEASRKLVHELRGRVDAVIVGGNTVRVDDPLLTARPPGPRTPTRVVISATGNLPADCQLVRTAKESPVLVATTAPGATRLAAWSAAGAEILTVGTLAAVFDELGRRRMTNVLVECGPKLQTAIADAGLGDDVVAFVAPRLIGGANTVVAGTTLSGLTVESAGGDVVIRGAVVKRP
jgi:diaminohydroxyphosphoribosylaminopyrimidine deaminase/5-amino-6-(5-phosphoribosylamino)uracil reductase